MTELDIAIARMTRWISSSADGKPQVFIGDLSMILLAAKEYARNDQTPPPKPQSEG